MPYFLDEDGSSVANWWFLGTSIATDGTVFVMDNDENANDQAAAQHVGHFLNKNFVLEFDVLLDSVGEPVKPMAGCQLAGPVYDFDPPHDEMEIATGGALTYGTKVLVLYDGADFRCVAQGAAPADTSAVRWVDEIVTMDFDEWHTVKIERIDFVHTLYFDGVELGTYVKGHAFHYDQFNGYEDPENPGNPLPDGGPMNGVELTGVDNAGLFWETEDDWTWTDLNTDVDGATLCPYSKQSTMVIEALSSNVSAHIGTKAYNGSVEQSWGVCVRWEDPDNFVRLVAAGSTLFLCDSFDTIWASWPISPETQNTITLYVDGQLYRCYYNNVLIGTYTDLTDAHIGGTKAGLACDTQTDDIILDHFELYAYDIDVPGLYVEPPSPEGDYLNLVHGSIQTGSITLPHYTHTAAKFRNVTAIEVPTVRTGTLLGIGAPLDLRPNPKVVVGQEILLGGTQAIAGSTQTPEMDPTHADPDGLYERVLVEVGETIGQKVPVDVTNFSDAEAPASLAKGDALRVSVLQDDPDAEGLTVDVLLHVQAGSTTESEED